MDTVTNSPGGQRSSAGLVTPEESALREGQGGFGPRRWMEVLPPGRRWKHCWKGHCWLNWTFLTVRSWSQAAERQLAGGISVSLSSVDQGGRETWATVPHWPHDSWPSVKLLKTQYYQGYFPRGLTDSIMVFCLFGTNPNGTPVCDGLSGGSEPAQWVGLLSLGSSQREAERNQPV